MTAAAAKPKSLRRRIVSTILWTLRLLLLTNIWWSLLAATSISDPGSRKTRVAYHYADGMIGGHWKVSIYATESDLRSTYNVSIVDYSWRETAPVFSEVSKPLEDVCPPWMHALVWDTIRSKKKSRHALTLKDVGWPFRLLWTGYKENPPNESPLIPWTGIQTANRQGEETLGGVLPVRPIWTGQAFYGAFWLGVVLIVPFTRRRIRTWRGRCVNCNYDLRANTTGVCPECGAPAAGTKVSAE